MRTLNNVNNFIQSKVFTTKLVIKNLKVCTSTLHTKPSTTKLGFSFKRITLYIVINEVFLLFRYMYSK
jgi:hypothetical protein